MRRTAAVVLALLAACSSSRGSKAASSGQSSSSASTTTTSGPTTTLNPSELSSLDSSGARSFLTLWAAGLHAREPSLTQAQLDCVPDAVLQHYTPDEFLTLLHSNLGSLGPDDVTKVTEALHSCGFTDEQVQKANLS